MISIIVPVFNVEKYILDCLNSIKKQTYTDFEVIIVNDGSQDKSVEIINKFLIDNKDMRFKLYNKTNGGLSDARNYGTNLANGKYIIFLDSDDYWDEGLLKCIHDEVETYSNLEIIRIPKRFVSENKKEISKDKINEFHSILGSQAFILLRENRITLETAWSYAIKLDYWKENNYLFPIGKLHEDIGLLPRILLEANSISSISTSSFYNYRQRDNSITTTKNEKIDLKKFNDLLNYYITEKNFIKNAKYDVKVSNMYIQYYADVVLLKYISIESKQKKILRNMIFKEKIISDYPIHSLKSLKKKIYYLFKVFIN